MSKRKEKEIKSAIREIMKDNVIRLVIGGQGESRERYRQNRKLFLYLEVKDTKPKIRYLYDLSEPVFMGRSEEENHICIRDRTVSKYQGRIWTENGRVYYADEPDAASQIRIRRYIWSVKRKRGERVRLRTKDCLMVGTVTIKIRLFMGEQEMFG
ncbi:MAG: FHA domain-containing protein [Clostridiales bacterium]|nr:FHA domain-containing protein [Clostridiales bacterium]